MKSVIIKQTGNANVLEIQETPVPTVQNDEILIKTTTIGINYADILVRKGIYPSVTPFPSVFPGEIEGIIEKLGTNVKHLHVGQKVTGYALNGYAEYACLHASQVFTLPENLPVGNGLLTQGLTAQYLLSLAQNYNSVVITAAAGGVGSFLVQLAKHKGVTTIIAAVSDKNKFDYVKSLGATHIISYEDEKWKEQISESTDGRGTDLILDAIGGDIGSALISQLAPMGTLVVYGSSSAKPTLVNAQELIYKSNRIIGATIFNATAADKQQWFTELIQWIQTGKLKMTFTKYTFDQVVKAHDEMENRKTTGKVILTL